MSKPKDETSASAKTPSEPWARSGLEPRFDGLRIVFSGKLEKLRKKETVAVLAAEGATIADKATKDTSVVVYAGSKAPAAAASFVVSEPEFRRRWLLPTPEQAFAMLTGGKKGPHRLASLLELNRAEYSRSTDEFSTVSLQKKALSGATLDGASLCGVEFRQCDLRGAHLTKAKWLANAEESDFRSATANSLELVAPRRCDWRDADLAKASIVGAEECRFDGANLTGASGRDSFTSCSFDRAKLDGFAASFTKLRRCSFSSASLQRAKLEGCELTDCSFAGADLRGATFQGDEDRVRIVRCNFEGADLRGVVLSHVRFEQCNLKGARFDGAKVSELELVDTDADEATGLERASGNAMEKGASYQALEAAAVTFKNVTIEAMLKIGAKKVECTLYQFDHGANTSCRQAWLGGKNIGALTLADAIATIASQNPTAKLDEKALKVKATKGTRPPSLKPKAFEAVVRGAWREALAGVTSADAKE